MKFIAAIVWMVLIPITMTLASLPLLQLNHDLTHLATSHPKLIDKQIIHVPAELGRDEIISLSETEVITQMTFQDLIDDQQKNGDPFILARIVTAGDRTETDYRNKRDSYAVEYYDADSFNTFIFKPAPGKSIEITRNNLLLYYFEKENEKTKKMQAVDYVLNDAINLDAFYKIKSSPLRFGIQYFKFDAKKPERGFQYLCSHYDLFINPHYEYWHAFFQANQNQNKKLKANALIFLSKYPDISPRAVAKAPIPPKNSVSIHTPQQIGSIEYLDAVTFSKFQSVIRENAQYEEPFILARTVTQNNNGQYFIHYFDAHTLNAQLFPHRMGVPPFVDINRRGDSITILHQYDADAFFEKLFGPFLIKLTQSDMLLYNVQNPVIQKYNPLRIIDDKEFYSNPSNTLPLTLGIQYFVYNPHKHDQGFQYLCSFYDLSINPHNRYWHLYFLANQNTDMRFREFAYNELALLYLEGKDGVALDFAKGIEYYIKHSKINMQLYRYPTTGLNPALRDKIQTAAKQTADKKLQANAQIALSMLNRYELSIQQYQNPLYY